MAKFEVPQPSPEAQAAFEQWVAYLDDAFTKHTDGAKRSEIVRDELCKLILGRTYDAAHADVTLAVVAENLDPRNVSLPTEMPSRNADTLDRTRWEQVKPLVWFWHQFDQLPVGQNLWLAFRVHDVLGRHLFAKMGKDVYIYPGFQFLRGYTITMLDGTRIEPNIQVDDRAAITLSGCVKK